MLADGERLRGIFHPSAHAPGHPDPTGAIEEWTSVEDARETFRERAQGRPGLTYYVGQPPERCDWYDVDDTAFMDVWIETVAPGDEDEPPGVPNDMWQRWTLSGTRVRRSNF